MKCKDFTDIGYIDIAAEDIKEKLKKGNFMVAYTALENLMQMLKSFFDNTENKKSILHMNQKLEHMMQVIEESLYYINKERHYAKDNSMLDDRQREVYILNAIFHDIGRIFEIFSLGNCGANIAFNHSLLGGEFLKACPNAPLFDNLGNRLPTDNIDRILTTKLEKEFDRQLKQEELSRIPRVKLFCVPYDINKLYISDKHTSEEIITYCVTHHGDKEIPEDCPADVKPYLSNVRMIDQIANYVQGSYIPIELITGGKTLEQIGTICQPVDLEEKGDNANVIDDITYKELTTGVTLPDGTLSFGINRSRNKDEQGRNYEYTPIRHFLSRVGWIYYDKDNDLSFYIYCKKSGCITEYCNKIRQFLRPEDKIRLEEIEEYAKRHIDKEIDEKSNIKTNNERLERV